MPSASNLAGGGVRCPELFGKSVLHETGHGLDWRVFGNGKYYGYDLASIGEGPLVGWLQAVRATEAFKAIEEIRLTEDNNWIY